MAQPDRRPNLVLRRLREQERRQTRAEFARDINRRAEQLGERVACDTRLVARWEDGETLSPRPVYQRILAAETGRPYEQLGFDWGLSPVSEAKAEHESTTDRISAAMLYPQVGPDSGLNLDDLRTAVTTAWRLRQRSRYEELGRYLPVVLPDLSAAATRATSEAAQDSTTRLLVHILNATSSLLKRLGAYDLALVAADRAIESSRRLDDPLLTAAAVHRLANVLLPAGRLDQCRDVAVRAADTIQSGGRQSPEGLGMWGALLLTAAVATARRGDSSRAWELLGEARAAGRLLGQDRADLFAVFGPVNAEIHAVQIAVELGDGHGAILRSAQVDPDGLPDYLIERRAQYLLDLTQAHILDANYSDAASSLCEADAAASEEVRFDPAARSALRLLLSKRPSASTSPLREMATRFGVE